MNETEDFEFLRDLLAHIPDVEKTPKKTKKRKSKKSDPFIVLNNAKKPKRRSRASKKLDFKYMDAVDAVDVDEGFPNALQPNPQDELVKRGFVVESLLSDEKGPRQDDVGADCETKTSQTRRKANVIECIMKDNLENRFKRVKNN